MCQFILGLIESHFEYKANFGLQYWHVQLQFLKYHALTFLHGKHKPNCFQSTSGQSHWINNDISGLSSTVYDQGWVIIILIIIIIIPFDAGGEIGEGDGVNEDDAGNGNKTSISNTVPHSAANFLTTSSVGPPWEMHSRNTLQCDFNSDISVINENLDSNSSTTLL